MGPAIRSLKAESEMEETKVQASLLSRLFAYFVGNTSPHFPTKLDIANWPWGFFVTRSSQTMFSRLPEASGKNRQPAVSTKLLIVTRA